ncbi:hypothetical protein Sjap_014059 [Stephania japonica]|uniref:DUF7815 domain-containing protein n=1 Tax=Stephania japonica TaxID=461633 RepID=A0AAP0J144_9MAGN
MALETSTSLIRQLQIALRKEVSVPSYDPDGPFHLPSLQEAIAEVDPSPPYLRCKQCNGRLFRDIQSLVCVFCGAQQRAEIPPDSIPFKSTIAYQWLLQSLDLTGSEIVSSNVANEGRNSPKDSLILSDLLDFELKWPLKPQKKQNDAADRAKDQSRSSLSLAGVDLDNFFSEEKKEISPSFFDDQTVRDRHVSNAETDAIPGQEGLSFFENYQAPDMAGRPASTEVVIDESLSGWESEFQAASSQKREISNPLDAASGLHTDISFFDKIGINDKPKADSVPLAPMAENWFPREQRDNSNIGGSDDQFAQFDANTGVNNNIEPTAISTDLSSMNDNLIPDELWRTGFTKTSNTQNSNENNNSFDAWQDFSGSASASIPFPDSWENTGPATVPSDEHSSKTNLVDGSQEIGFSNFMQADLFAEPFSLHNGSTDSNSYLDGSAPFREDAKTEGIVTVEANSPHEEFNAALQTKYVDTAVETLMSQMHDLSFMLESELSIPKKTNGFDSTSWS